MVSKVVIAIVVAIGVMIVRKVLNWAWLKPKKLEKWLRDEGYKGNSYKVVVGDMEELSTMMMEAKSKAMPITHDITSHVLPFDHHIISKYGKRSFMWFGPTPRIYITDPELIKEILWRPNEFQKPHPEPIRDSIIAGLLASEDMNDKWQLLTAETGVMEVDVWPFIDNLAGDIISRTAFGSCYEEGRKIFRIQKEQTYLKAIDIGEHGDNDLLGILLESNSKEIEEDGIGMSMEDVIEECKLFYLAGSETTSNLIVWTMVCLSLHQEWQIRARQEVQQVFGTEELNFDGLKHLKIVTMILNEVLRLYPPAVMVTRATSKETKLGNMMIPSGVHITIPIIYVHHDREIWGEDATEFKPERFSEGVANATKTGGPSAFLPFTSGPRVCIGQNFAMIEAKTAIAKILQRFSFQLSPSYTHSPFPVFTLPPRFGAHLILRSI
ncbi:cytochrome P450 [Cynara cardunculus var. scolymus]|uniref:Cytochrome P450 n=1 Tax=Cynara cardunculus var. scolymus TaxID=59895 RepID=A0A103Y409_CYNCS|nr:cytochrome P450 [Cynara cardunculus var. scolymus]